MVRSAYDPVEEASADLVTGTLLGATFAAMFPDRVGRLILDGVVDADLYVSPLWSESIQDTDEVWSSFFVYCAKAGAGKCAIARDGDTPKDVRDRIFSDLDTLKKQSIIGISSRFDSPSIVTWTEFKSVIFSILYSPTRGFPLLAYLLDLLHRGRD